MGGVGSRNNNLKSKAAELHNTGSGIHVEYRERHAVGQ